MAHHKGFGLVEVADTYVDIVAVGSKLKFAGEKQRYTVRASNRFFSVCTKPLNIHKTVLYTVIDWHHQIRGTENLVFGMGAETDDECEEMLQRLTNAKSDISHRNWSKLLLERYDPPTK